MYACFCQYNATKYKFDSVNQVPSRNDSRFCYTREINKIHFAVVLIRHDFLPYSGIKDCAVFTNCSM